jgi:hypothetical protein
MKKDWLVLDGIEQKLYFNSLETDQIQAAIQVLVEHIGVTEFGKVNVCVSGKRLPNFMSYSKFVSEFEKNRSSFSSRVLRFFMQHRETPFDLRVLLRQEESQEKEVGHSFSLIITKEKSRLINADEMFEKLAVIAKAVYGHIHNANRIDFLSSHRIGKSKWPIVREYDPVKPPNDCLAPTGN